MDDCGQGRSAMATLTAAGCLGPECIAVHLNEWEPDDFALAAPAGPLAGMTVVHCPLSHRYFRHREFPWEKLRALSLNLCVGTDSPASDGSFSLLEELRTLSDCIPTLSPVGLLETITRAPARAIGFDGRLGCLRPGAFADMIAIPCGDVGTPNTIHAEILACRAPTVWQMVNGSVLSASRA
jgi:aminodeoxyfutalosine deaminase